MLQLKLTAQCLLHRAAHAEKHGITWTECIDCRKSANRVSGMIANVMAAHHFAASATVPATDAQR
jgi:hypothetical protein